jgi:uncharacterized membrane protein YqjE
MNDTAPPLIARGKSLLDQILRMAQTRLELLAVEIQHEKLALGRQLQLATIAAILALLAGLTLIVWIALALPQEYRLIVLGALFVVLVAGAVGCVLALKRYSKREPVFNRVINQLRMDRASLHQEP